MSPWTRPQPSWPGHAPVDPAAARVDTAAATAAVPSVLASSTSTTENAPGYSCASSVGRVSGRIAASSRAGTTATTLGHGCGPGEPGDPGRRTSVRQNPPCPASRYTQAAAASTQAATRISTPAASHTSPAAPSQGGPGAPAGG